MAAGGIALVAEQGARLFRRELEHLRALGDRFGELELAGVDASEVVMAAGAGGGAALGRGTEGAQVDIVDSSLGQRVAERRLRETGAARIGDGADVDHALDPGLLKRRDKLADGGAFIADGEDAGKGDDAILGWWVGGSLRFWPKRDAVDILRRWIADYLFRTKVRRKLSSQR